jgi:hypothetical protein
MPHHPPNQLGLIAPGAGANSSYSIHNPTQPTSNISSINTNFNNTLTIIHSKTSSSSSSEQNTDSNTTFNPNHNEEVPAVSPNNNKFNIQYGCQSVLASKRDSFKTQTDNLRVLYCIYTGCDWQATRKRINALLENKHSAVTFCSIKTVKKLAVEELDHCFSYLLLKEMGVLGFDKVLFRPTNKSLEEIGNYFKSLSFKLPTGEKLYLEFEMEAYLSHHENELAIC